MAPSHPAGTLRRVLRLHHVVAMAVGTSIGMGILKLPGPVAGYLDGWGLILGVWAAAAVVVGTSALAVAELAGALPDVGGKYAYVRAGLGPGAGFAVALLTVAAILVSGAAKTIAAAVFLALLFGRGSVAAWSACVVLGFLVLHARGVRAAAGAQTGLTVAKVGVLIAMIAAGLSLAPHAAATPAPVLLTAGLLPRLALAYPLVASSYYGLELSVVMAEEVSNPARAVPRALLASAAVIGVLYLALNAAFLRALPPGALAASPFVGRDIVLRALGPTAGVVVTAVAIVIVLGTLNGNFLVYPRMTLALARDGLAPGWLARLSRAGIPLAALVVGGAAMLGIAMAGAFEWLIRLMMLFFAVGDALVVLALIALRRRQPALSRPFRMPWYPVLPAALLICHGLLVAAVLIAQPELLVAAAAGTALLIASGIAVSVLLPRLRPPPAPPDSY